jgi:hypothetical protein
MALHWFHPPVNIETDRPGLTYGCNNVKGAAAELMKWTKRGLCGRRRSRSAWA